jgi:hypothetical protein
MNNEPVAWLSQGGDVSRSADYFEEMGFKDLIPLYTHPVKELDEQFKKGFEAGKEEGWKARKFHHPAKELTDEEITQVFDECYPNNGDGDVVTLIDFARAILRKASEK